MMKREIVKRDEGERDSEEMRKGEIVKRDEGERDNEER
jgi:hypothetical protein